MEMKESYRFIVMVIKYRPDLAPKHTSSVRRGRPIWFNEFRNVDLTLV